MPRVSYSFFKTLEMMWPHLFLSHLHEVIEQIQDVWSPRLLSALCPTWAIAVISLATANPVNLGPSFLLAKLSSSSLYPAQCLAEYIFNKQISGHKAWSLTSPKFTTKIRLWVAEKLYPFINGMTFFSLFQLVEGRETNKLCECNWISFLKAVHSSIKYISVWWSSSITEF